MRSPLHHCLAAALGAVALLLAVLNAADAAARGDTSGGDFDALPGWQEDHVADIIPLLASSCPRLDASFAAACREIARVPRGDETAARLFLQWAFRPTYVGAAKFTGYFELDVPGARVQGGPYQWPLLHPPSDPHRYNRAQVLGGALGGQGLELVWLTSAADLYFVQLQGSARVHLPDGGVMRVGGAAQNGWGSIATADLFGDAGIPNHDLSIPAIRAWAAAHPREAEARIARDGAYFYFAERPIGASDGPTGALGVGLTPLRSVAVDPHQIKLGAPVWVDTEISAGRRKLQRMMLAQDTGEPIRGAAHIDVFFGPGNAAEAVGGRQNASGGLWVLLPR